MLNVFQRICDMLSFSVISRVVLRRLFFNIAFISSSTSVGRPERGASLKSKSPERKRADQFWHWRSVNDFSKCDENDRLGSPFQINEKQ